MESLEARLQKADRLAAITQHIGFAIWQLQELEGCAAQYYVLVAQAKPGMGAEAGNELLKKAQRKTFGMTIDSLAKANLLPAELGERFHRLLAERNWLVHNSRATNRNAIHDDHAAKRLVSRIGGIAEEAGSLLSEIGNLIETFVGKHGVRLKDIELAAASLLEEWHKVPD